MYLRNSETLTIFHVCVFGDALEILRKCFPLHVPLGVLRERKLKICWMKGLQECPHEFIWNNHSDRDGQVEGESYLWSSLKATHLSIYWYWIILCLTIMHFGIDPLATHFSSKIQPEIVLLLHHQLWQCSLHTSWDISHTFISLCARTCRWSQVFQHHPRQSRAVGRYCLWSLSSSLLTHTPAQFAVLCGSFWCLEVSHPTFTWVYSVNRTATSPSLIIHIKKGKCAHIKLGIEVKV